VAPFLNLEIYKSAIKHVEKIVDEETPLGKLLALREVMNQIRIARRAVVEDDEGDPA